MSRQPTHGEVAALRVWTQQLEDIQRQFSAQDRQHEHPRTPAAPAPEIPLDDWDALLSAVKDRLRATVGESRTNGAPAPWQASVLECVDALDKLQLTLSQSLAGQGQIARGEPNSPLPGLPHLESPQQRLDLDLDLSSAATMRPATGAAGLGSRNT